VVIPLELPVRAGEAAALADMILQLTEKKALNEELRQRIATRGAALKLQALTPHYGSLQKDPSHQSAYFFAVDGIRGEPLLLRFAPASSPASALFPQSILIGRMRPGTREIVVNCVPFGPDNDTIRKYVEQVDPMLLPRPQGPQSAISLSTAQPEIEVPLAFTAFRTINKKSGMNVASVTLTNPTAANSGRFYDTVLWAAMRAGWREGYNLGVSVAIDGTERAMESARSLIREAQGYSRFIVDVSSVSEADVSEQDGAWCLQEFSRTFATGAAEHEMNSDEIIRLARKFHAALVQCEQVYDYIRMIKRTFDFEIVMDARTPQELLFGLHFLKARGRAVQFVTPPIDALAEMAPVARFFNTALSVAADADLQLIGRACGRWNCTVSNPQQIVECWEQLRAG